MSRTKLMGIVCFTIIVFLGAPFALTAGQGKSQDVIILKSAEGDTDIKTSVANQNQSNSFQTNEAVNRIEKKRNKVTVDDDGPADYSSIQAAIDGEPDGTDIEVMPGTYSGFIVNGRSDLKIKGVKDKKSKKNDSSPVSVMSKPELIIDEKGGDCASVGLWGEYPIPGGRCTLSVAIIDSINIDCDGIKVDCSDHPIVSENSFGIACIESSVKVKNCEITGNTIFPHSRSIGVFGTNSVGTVIIEQNYIHSYGEKGIFVDATDPETGEFIPGGCHAVIKGNYIEGTALVTPNRLQLGIVVKNGASATITDNIIEGNRTTGGSDYLSAGLQVVNAFNVETNKNEYTNNQVGIAIGQYVDYALFNGDYISSNDWGIYIWVPIPSTIEVKKTLFENNRFGTYCKYTAGLVFEDNEVVGCEEDGLVLNNCDNFTCKKVTVVDCGGNGVFLYHCDNQRFQKTNIMSNGGDGVVSIDSDRLVFNKCHLEDNDGHGYNAMCIFDEESVCTYVKSNIIKNAGDVYIGENCIVYLDDSDVGTIEGAGEVIYK